MEADSISAPYFVDEIASELTAFTTPDAPTSVVKVVAEI
jgi:hypothetical protein